MSDKEFNETLKLTRHALLISGIKISNKTKNKALEYFINHYLFYCNFIALYTVIFGETYWVVAGIRNRLPFVELSLISPCITISILSTIKTWFLFINKGILLNVVERLKAIQPIVNNDVLDKTDAIKRKIVRDSMKLLKFVHVSLMTVYIFVFTTFCFSPALLSSYNYFKTGEFACVYPYQVKYFFEVYKSSLWFVVYVHQVWATAIVIFSVYGCDTLFCALCVYIKMHFRLLGLQFENAVSTSINETRKNLGKAVLRHQELIDLVNQMEVLFSKSSLFNMVTSSILICLSAFNITVADEMRFILAFITFLMMSLSQISLVCYFADLLMISSIEISDSVYKCPWYEADEDSKRTILFVILRSHKACRLTAWKFADLNLGAFTTILSRSWSYFALLKTVYK
ncbi:odorant receptor 4-like [Spodoptera litura]|uniref:Odorant receptor n=1 Tax=Spodoptera litura TaxID=69820 RepID=A0A9J7EXQ7_SPOLT|nr:odorant receptor 4-like [Spodoptera litura]